MSHSPKPAPGTIAWRDLTTANAEEVRDFYQEVTGWRPEPVEMDGYQDFSMIPAGSDEAVAGICHARGANADLPAQWLMYIIVANLDESMASCRRKGGEIISGPRTMGQSRFCIIKDPAGAVAALYQPEP